MLEIPASAWTGPPFPAEAEGGDLSSPECDRIIDWGLFATRILLGAALAVMMIARMPRDFSLLIGVAALAVVEIGNFAIVLPLILRRSPASRIHGLWLDTLSLMGTGGGIAILLSTGYSPAGAEILWNNFWPVYGVLIVAAAFHLSARKMFVYSGFLTSFFLLAQIIAFPIDSTVIDHLPIRALFLVVFGILLAGFAAELQRRQVRVEHGLRVLHEQSFDTIVLLATIVEARDDTTGEHLQRMQRYSRVLARSLGLSPDMVDAISEASLIHDVGKAWTPEYILNKPGPLTPDERRIMERHVIDGERLLGNRPAYEVHRQVARSHHERWDGCGYPDRLSGDDIPLGARIVAVADVYDALTSERPYKPAWSSRRAAVEIRRQMGKQFDPEIALTFLRLLETGVFGYVVDGEERSNLPARRSGLRSA